MRRLPEPELDEQDTHWSQEQYLRSGLPDGRLWRSLEQMRRACGRHPGQPPPAIFPQAVEYKAAVRFLYRCRATHMDRNSSRDLSVRSQWRRTPRIAPTPWSLERTISRNSSLMARLRVAVGRSSGSLLEIRWDRHSFTDRDGVEARAERGDRTAPPCDPR